MLREGSEGVKASFRKADALAEYWLWLILQSSVFPVIVSLFSLLVGLPIILVIGDY
jgi:hypothetical protein